MWTGKVLVIIGFLHSQSVFAQWSCTQDSECAALAGSVCTSSGACACPLGQQSVLGGTMCTNLAPYHMSTCVEDHQCTRLFANFECRKEDDSEEGACVCQPGHHYFLGRCWRTVGYGGVCSRDEECLGVIRDPYSLRCNETCSCADGYYSRQRGECRRIAYAVGDGCVVNEDCQFAGAICDIGTLTCVLNGTVTQQEIFPQNVMNSVASSLPRQHGVACSATNLCPEPFECSTFGSCVCPVGYYASGNGANCYAELGSRSTAEECVGLLAELRDGVCTCLSNFFFEENMIDCTRVTRQITESCVNDANCHTFGAAARCGPPQDPWQLRSCECDPEQSVWDASRSMCRLFAGIGETCQVDSDCLAGEIEISCVIDAEGEGYCACPEGLLAVDGLCLTTGLALGDACQATQECTETANTVCNNDRCSCGNGYQEVDDYCAPIIGGTCELDSDCVIENTICRNNSNEFTCQCSDLFVPYNEECWPTVSEYEGPCNVTVQCAAGFGEAGVCANNSCVCNSSYHYRDQGCWPITGLFDACSRTSQCYMTEMSERVVCRNSMCQCDFGFPYSEELHTCTSSAPTIIGSAFTIMAALIYLCSS